MDDHALPIHPQQKALLPTIEKTVGKNSDIAAMTEISRGWAKWGDQELSCRGGTALYTRGAAVAAVAAWAVTVAASPRGGKEVDTGGGSKDMEAECLQLEGDMREHMRVRHVETTYAGLCPRCGLAFWDLQDWPVVSRIRLLNGVICRTESLEYVGRMDANQANLRAQRSLSHQKVDYPDARGTAPG
ncbi:hypothetical protein FB45DRAFT_873933 [Roridomyces roridus]|uniref:Uncharacterized protein n=1 Tax=Roridomyces roridus TaxID=1738132 RepID=A0AAD7B9P6_9AGAR|nr:hypothetical protein FB45DRAFT_873933 [Roridomyces roridus]